MVRPVMRWKTQRLRHLFAQPQLRNDIDKEGIGITVEYNDVQVRIDAIRQIADHPEEARRMGENARKLAEERFNLEIFSREIAESLLEISNISSKNRTFRCCR